MKKYELVSIVIPCYNQAQYLEEAVQSAVDQTYPNIEVIIVDDGSSDNTRKVADRLRQNNPNIVHLLLQENSGVSTARNNGIKVSSGQYIVPLDADDTLNKEMVNACMHIIKKYQTDIVYTDFERFGLVEQRCQWNDFSESNPLYFTPCGPVALYKRKVWEQTGGYQEKLINNEYEDWEFWINAYKHGFLFKHHDEVLYYYRTKEVSGYTVAYAKDSYIKAKLVMFHPEIYTEHRVQEAINTIKKTEKLADIYLYFPKNIKVDKKHISSLLNNHLASKPLSETQVIPLPDINIGLCSLELFEGMHSVDTLSKKLGTNLVLFYSPLRYQVSELQTNEFAWDQDKGVINAQGILFPFVYKSLRESPKNLQFASKHLELYYEYIKNKMDNLQYKYNIDTVKAQNKFDSLQHKYDIDIDITNKKLTNLQHKYNIDIVKAQNKFNSLQHKYDIDIDIMNKKLTNLQYRHEILNTKFDILMGQLSNFAKAGIIKNPLKMIRVYKNLLSLYRQYKK